MQRAEMNIFSIADNKRSGAATDNCVTCRAAPFCIAERAGQDGMDLPLTTQRIRVARDAQLFQTGELVRDRFYAVHFGTFKYSLITPSGHPKISAFLMSGDLLGLDAVGQIRHHGIATALEVSEVCEVRYSDMQSRPLLLHGLVSRQIAREQVAAHLLRNSSAAQRLAAFLLDLSWRHYRRGYSSQRFRLVMARQDIANFLALSPECLSRELAHFKETGLLAVDDREVTLRDVQALRQLAAGIATTAAVCQPPSPNDPVLP